MSTSGRSEAPINYSTFHILYRHALITEHGIDSGIVDGDILPHRVPQLYASWRGLRTRDNPRTVAKQLAQDTVEKGEYSGKTTQEEAREEISRILREVYGPVLAEEIAEAYRENVGRLYAGEVSGESGEETEDSTGGDL